MLALMIVRPLLKEGSEVACHSGFSSYKDERESYDGTRLPHGSDLAQTTNNEAICWECNFE